MLHPDEALYTLLCKYLLQEADPVERQWVDSWLSSNPEHPMLLAALDKLLNTTPKESIPGAMDTDTAWQLLNSKLPPERKIRSTWWLAAAVIFITLAAGWWFTSNTTHTQDYTGIQTASLNDGTKIQLKTATSELKILSPRKVNLKGKALFDVTTDAAHPFIIDLGTHTVIVLGTRLLIDNTSTFRVYVNSGKVMVTNKQKGDSVFLTAGMLLAQDTTTANYSIGSHITDVDKQTLVFKDTPIKEVLQSVNALYHIHATADSTILDLPVSATFTGEPVKNILEAVAYMTNSFVVEQEGNFELKK